MKQEEKLKGEHLVLNTKTITEAREARDQDPDLFYETRLKGSVAVADTRPQCFIQLFQESVTVPKMTTTGVKTSTATREQDEQEEAVSAMSTETGTRAREEMDQDESSRSYHAIPKF
jgi:hypothetical protein